MRTMRELVMKVGDEDTAAMRQNLDEQARQTDRDIQLQRIEHMLKAATPDDVKDVVSDYKTDLSRQASFAHPAHPLSLYLSGCRPPSDARAPMPAHTTPRLSHTPLPLQTSPDIATQDMAAQLHAIAEQAEARVKAAEESAEAANNRLAVLELDLEGASFRDQQLQEKTEEVHGTRLGPTDRSHARADPPLSTSLTALLLPPFLRRAW